MNKASSLRAPFSTFILEGFQPASHLAYGTDTEQPSTPPEVDGRHLIFTSDTGYQLFALREGGEIVNYSIVAPDGTEQDGVLITHRLAPIEVGVSPRDRVITETTYLCWEDHRAQCSHCKQVMQM